MRPRSAPTSTTVFALGKKQTKKALKKGKKSTAKLTVVAVDAFGNESTAKFKVKVKKKRK